MSNVGEKEINEVIGHIKANAKKIINLKIIVSYHCKDFYGSCR